MKVIASLFLVAVVLGHGFSRDAQNPSSSGVPMIAPPPKVISYDETSASLGRRHMNIYGNGELTKVYVFVKKENEADGIETEFSPNFPLKVTGLEAGKQYTFAWRFANEKGTQKEYSRPSFPIVTSSPGVPSAPRELFMKVEGDELQVAWRHVETNGRPVTKFNVRLALRDTGVVVAERTVFKRRTSFTDLDFTKAYIADVNVVTAMGVSKWSSAYVYAPMDPLITIEGANVFDIVSIIQVNITSPGTVLCSLYGPSSRPVHKEIQADFAGHAHIIMEVEPNTSYSVECSLNAKDTVVHSQKYSLKTPEHTDQHIAITDIEPFSSFARVSVRSNVPGFVRCMPVRKEFGDVSANSFSRFSQRFQITDVSEPYTFVATDLVQGREYTIRCAMEHELLHHTHHAKGRHLADVVVDESFRTLDTVLAVVPRVHAFTPDNGESVKPGSLVTIVFDTPIVLGSGLVYVGTSATQDVPMTVQSVNDVFMSVIMPQFAGPRVFLRVEAGAVKSAESALPNEAFVFQSSVFWNIDTTTTTNQCGLMNSVIAPVNGIIRMSCRDVVTIPDICTITVAGSTYAKSDMHTTGKLIAVTMKDHLTSGAQYMIQFASACNLVSSGGLTVSMSLPVPKLESAEPQGELLAGQKHHFKLTLDAPFAFISSTDAVTFSLQGLFMYMPPLDVAPIASGNTIEFDYLIEADWADATLVVTVDRFNVHDDLGVSIPEDLVFYRYIGGLCGPDYLAEKAQDSNACRCKRGSDKCECQCGSVVGVVEY